MSDRLEHVADDAIIGEGTFIGRFVIIDTKCRIGVDCLLQDRNRLGVGCVLGGNVTMKCGAILTAWTRLGEHVFMGPNSICLGPNHPVNGVQTEIGDWVRIGAGTLIDPGVKICADAIVGALSYVKSDITEPGTYVGIPARRVK